MFSTWICIDRPNHKLSALSKINSMQMVKQLDGISSWWDFWKWKKQFDLLSILMNWWMVLNHTLSVTTVANFPAIAPTTTKAFWHTVARTHSITRDSLKNARQEVTCSTLLTWSVVLFNWFSIDGRWIWIVVFFNTRDNLKNRNWKLKYFKLKLSTYRKNSIYSHPMNRLDAQPADLSKQQWYRKPKCSEWRPRGMKQIWKTF